MAAPSIDATGKIVYPAGYAPNPNTGPLELVTPIPDIVTADVIGADLANVNIAFLQHLGTPTTTDPNLSITDPQDKALQADWEKFGPTATATDLTRVGDVLGHILGGTNATGDWLAKLISDEINAGNGTANQTATQKLESWHGLYYGPKAEEKGSIEHYLDAVAKGATPNAAYTTTLAEAPFKPIITPTV
jgi:hypothetical protein